MEHNQKTSAQSSNKVVRRRPLLLVVVVAISSGYIGGFFATRVNQSASVMQSQVSQQVLSSEGEVISSVAEQVGQSVVSIDVTNRQIVQDFFGFQRQSRQQAAGTGVIIDADGVIVTNKHVVQSKDAEVKVTLFDGTELPAKVVALDPRNDIAFVRISDKKGKELVPAKLGNSDDIKVGERVIAIGNALGEFQNTVTSGIISGRGRDITAGEAGDSEELSNLIQTDAAINQGNSGGPLVNLAGLVIGINTAITGNSAGQSLGFAIPVNDIKNQVSSVLENGKIERPYLGIRYQTITERLARIYNLPTNQGAWIPPSELDGETSIVPDSAAAKAGLKEQDIIVKVNDQAVDQSNEFVSVIGRFKVGETVTLTINRDGKEETLQATLSAVPE